MLVASVKGKAMVTEVSPVIGKSSGRTGETKQREMAGKPDYFLAQMKGESLQWKTVKSYAGNATAKQCRANNLIFLF